MANTPRHDIHIALTVDDAYAMAGAVAIRSAIAHTTGRIVFHVVHRNLSQESQDRLKQSTSRTAYEASIIFIELPPLDPPTARSALAWAKIDMIPFLPAGRVIYLDADVLVRGDLRPLWESDLEGRAIAAAVDVGLPMGHAGVGHAPYFNAGVLVMDLAKIKPRFPELDAQATAMETSFHRDEDALNTYFAGRWARLSLKWNAQGLGTYARRESAEGSLLDLGGMENPSIVHFTGPVHPSMAAILDSHDQPYTAKPWGYAGAPGHPYAQEWHDMSELTAWSGWKSTAAYREEMGRVEVEAIAKGVVEFRKRLEAARCREDH